MQNRDDADTQLLETLRAEFRKTETIERLFECVLPHLEQGRKSLVYILAQVGRIGHAVAEPLLLNQLVGQNYDRIILITGEDSGPGYNPYVLQCIPPNFVHVVTKDEILPLLGFLDNGIVDLQLFDLCLMSPQKLFRDAGYLAGKTPETLFSLSDEVRSIGDAFMRSIGKPADAPHVLLHVRDLSYLPEKAHHSFRCADIRTYASSIRELVKAGYWVFRIGDDSGPPLEGLPREVIDVPHHPEYSRALDVYLCAECAFAFNTTSGPYYLVRAFGRPALAVNLAYDLTRVPHPQDLLLFKDYLDAETGERLSYEDILERDLPTLSTTEAFTEAGAVIVDNTEEELLAATKLMLGRIRGEEIASDTVRLEKFWELSAAYERKLQADPKAKAEFMDIYPLALGIGMPAPFLLERDGYLDAAGNNN